MRLCKYQCVLMPVSSWRCISGAYPLVTDQQPVQYGLVTFYLLLIINVWHVHIHKNMLFRAKRGFYSGSAEIVWLQPILFAWLLKGCSCLSERARLHRWPSGWQTWMAIFKRTQSTYKPIDLLDSLYLAQKFASALNLRPSSRSSLAASLSSWNMSNMDFYSLESRH